MKVRVLAFLTVASLGLVPVADAGQKWVYPVWVAKNADGSGSMGGTLGSTRNSADTVTRLGCFYESFTTAYGGYKYASCYGFDGTNQLSCGTTDTALTDTIARLQGDAFLWVQADAAGNCVRVQIGAQSYAAPKAP